MLTNASQVLVRNEELFMQGRWLLANPAEGFIFKELGNPDVSGFHQYYDVYQQSVTLTDEARHIFAEALSTDTPFDGAVVYMPKSKQHAKMLLANVASCVKAGGQLLLVGENKEGVKSGAKLLEGFGERVNKIDSARHCSLFVTQVNDDVAPFSLPDWLSEFTVKVGALHYPVASLPGVFSDGELDAGTRLLLEQNYALTSERLLDFACGAGVIGVGLAKQHPSITITMSDINALSLFCARKSCEMNNVQARVLASNGLKDINGKFDAVFTNPPFHTGVKTDYSITETFIRDIRQHLAPGGQLTLVANRFLKYPQLLEGCLGNVATIAQTNKFNLYKSKN